MRNALTLCALLCLFAPACAAADTPALVQKALQAVCDRASAGYVHANVNEYLTELDPHFVETDVSGEASTYAEIAKATAHHFAVQQPPFVARRTIKSVVVSGDTAQTVQEWHYRHAHPRTDDTPAYTFQSDMVEHAHWAKAADGWHETARQIVRDVTTYSR